MQSTTIPDDDFQGMIWAPGSELEVVLLFALLPYLGKNYLIDECRGQFPDCILKTKDGQEMRAEFELFSSHFKDHGHDPTQCDVIVCWKHNWPECPIEVLDLSQSVKNLKPSIIANPNDYKYKKTLWDEVSFFAKVPPRHMAFIRELHDSCLSHGLRIEYGKGDRIPSFTVHLVAPMAPSKAFLGVYANGKVWPLFGDDVLTPEVASQFKNTFRRIPRQEKTIGTKKWKEFVLENEGELQIVKDAISWIAGLDWRQIRGSQAV